jgi:hypothetical protein
MLDRLYDRILADSERDSEASGYLSYRAEWHAAAWGLSVGLLAMFLGRPEILAAGVGWIFTRGRDGDAPDWLPYPRQFGKESLYVIGHAVGGIAIGLGLRALLPVF